MKNNKIKTVVARNMIIEAMSKADGVGRQAILSLICASSCHHWMMWLDSTKPEVSQSVILWELRSYWSTRNQSFAKQQDCNINFKFQAFLAILSDSLYKCALLEHNGSYKLPFRNSSLSATQGFWSTFCILMTTFFQILPSITFTCAAYISCMV